MSNGRGSLLKFVNHLTTNGEKIQCVYTDIKYQNEDYDAIVETEYNIYILEMPKQYDIKNITNRIKRIHNNINKSSFVRPKKPIKIVLVVDDSILNIGNFSGLEALMFPVTIFFTSK